MAQHDSAETEILDHRLVDELEKDELIPLDLYTACMIGDYSTVRKFVSNGGTDLNRKNKNGGWTALMYAAFVGRDTIVNMLLEASVDVNAVTTKTGTSALMLASNCGNESVTYFLLQQGANVNARDRKGQTALFHAVEGGHINVVKLLLDCDADIEASQVYTQLTPLMVAAIEGHAVIFSMLLEYGANLNTKSQVGDNAYTLAMNNGNITIMNIVENVWKKHKNEQLREEPGLFDNDLGIRDGPERIAKLTQAARELSLHQGNSGRARTRDMVPPIDARDYEPVDGSWNHTDIGVGDSNLNSDQGWVVNEKVYSQSDGAKQALKGDISQTIIIPTRKKVSRICTEPPKQSLQAQDQSSSAVDSLADILEELKLTKYHSCFESECVDLDTFFSLTDDDLKQIGIDKLGPRKKILSYISKSTQAKGDDYFGNQDADSALQEAHAFVEYLQAQVYKERQGRHELESYFVAERSKMDKITKHARHLKKSLDEIVLNVEHLRSVTTKASSAIQKPDNTKQKESDQAKTLGEPHNEANTIVDDLTSKVNSACRSSDTIIMLCTEEFQPQST